MDLGLQGKVAIVAASSKGLGWPARRRLARDGAQVMMCSRDADAIARAAEAVQRERCKAKMAVAQSGMVADVTQRDQITDWSTQRSPRTAGSTFWSATQAVLRPAHSRRSKKTPILTL